eukprot:23411_1
MATHLSDIENTELECEDIQDSIHLSELIFDTSQTTSQIFSILNIPTDVLLHINHFLSANDLTQLQKTCRYFRLMARNPLSLYSLEVGGAGQFAAYTYDHIQHLILDIYNVNGVTVANRNWNNTVHEITFDAKTPRFRTLTLNNANTRSDARARLWQMEMSMHTNDVAQQLFDNKCIILGGQVTVDNITKLNIHGA